MSEPQNPRTPEPQNPRNPETQKPRNPETQKPRNPESNGMAEALVKTFKRDYVYLSERPDAATVMVQLAGWFEDYNSFHPHSGLKMMSPREYPALKMAS